MQAAFLTEKLKYLKRDIKERNKVAKFYLNNIKNPLIKLPFIPSNINHAWHLFVVKLDDILSRKKFQMYLHSKGIETGIHYPVAIHKQKAYFEYVKLNLEVAEMTAQARPPE